MGKGRHYEPKDRLYHQAKKQGYASRAAYKLLELAEKYRLFSPGGVVLDLGCAPGSWTQVACKEVGTEGLVIGIDLQALSSSQDWPKHFHFIHGDIEQEETLQQLDELLRRHAHQKVQVVLSDLSPKLSGIRLKDHVQSLAFAEIASRLAKKYLAENGSLIMKIFPGEDLEPFRKRLNPSFKTTKILELDASRSTSREVYLVASGFRSA